MVYSFEDFLKDDQWHNLKDHFNTFNAKIEEKIKTAVKNNKREIIRKGLEAKYGIMRENSKLTEELKKELLAGNVVAIDGTCADYDLTLVGFQARIGIIAINYRNIRSGYTLYISDPFIPYEKEDFEEIFKYAKQKKSKNVGISSTHIRSVMLFKERDFILKRPEKYKMVQGDIFPYELRIGQGKLQGLDVCLRLGRELLSCDTIVATQTTTHDPRLRLVGIALNAGEYIVLSDYYDDLNEFLDTAHFKKTGEGSDEEKFRRFIEDANNKFVRGVYKASNSNRAYVFYAPKQNIERMVHLLFADSSFQPIRGFPLLLDYADSMCSRLLSAGDFTKQIEAKLARNKILDAEKEEKSTRRR